MTEEALAAAGQALGAAYRDAPWRSLGFPRRPRGGSFWRKHFRAEWKNQLDHRVVQQIIAMFTTVSVLAGSIRRAELHDVVAVYADGYGDVQSLYRTLGYDTRTHAVTHLYDCISQYADAAPSEWPALLVKHLDAFNLPDEKVAARLLMGVIEFSRRIESLADPMRRESTGATG